MTFRARLLSKYVHIEDTKICFIVKFTENVLILSVKLRLKKRITSKKHTYFDFLKKIIQSIFKQRWAIASGWGLLAKFCTAALLLKLTGPKLKNDSICTWFFCNKILILQRIYHKLNWNGQNIFNQQSRKGGAAGGGGCRAAITRREAPFGIRSAVQVQ